MYYKSARISFAKMLIPVNVTKSLPTEVAVMDPYGREFEQEVEYDLKP